MVASGVCVWRVAHPKFFTNLTSPQNWVPHSFTFFVKGWEPRTPTIQSPILSSDSVMGDWLYNYDTLNRLTSTQNALATSIAPQYAGQYGCWSYDPFGNRKQEAYSTATSTPCATGANDNVLTTTRTYNSLNQDTGFQYDAAGNVIQDLINKYVYDPEGRLCAVKSILATTATQYVYDAEGRARSQGHYLLLARAGSHLRRAHRGQRLHAHRAISSRPRRRAGHGTDRQRRHGSTPTSGPARIWTLHTIPPACTSILPTRWARAAYRPAPCGLVEENCLSLPFGNGENCIVPPTAPATADDATEHHFTGKERDTESGNDYFGARYFGSSMGRFLSPDPLMASAKVWDPQTWNRYTYGRNNPLRMIDPTGMAEVTADQCAQDKHCVTVNINVIYDKNSNGGKGLTDDQKAAFEKNQLQNAKDQYGNADIHFNVSYSAGALSTDNGKMSLSGIQSGALNVVVTDQIGTAVSGMAGKTAVSMVNANSTDKEDLPHEMAHQFMGDTQGMQAAIMRHDPSGISSLVFDAFHDIANDTERAWMRNLDQHSGAFSHYPLASAFHDNAAAFQKSIQPTMQP